MNHKKPTLEINYEYVEDENNEESIRDVYALLFQKIMQESVFESRYFNFYSAMTMISSTEAHSHFNFSVLTKYQNAIYTYN